MEVASDVILSLRDITVHLGYSKRRVLANISFDVCQGERVYILGPTGAGKTTLLYTIYGMWKPTSGSVWFNNMEITSHSRPPLEKWRRDIGFAFQDYKLLMDRTVIENVTIPLVLRGFAREDVLSFAYKALEVVGMKERDKDFPSMLSGGEQQLVSLARAIAFRPKLLLADEPTAGLDNITSEKVLKALEHIRDEYNITMLIATHNVDIAARRATRIIRIEGGKLRVDAYGKGKIPQD